MKNLYYLAYCFFFFSCFTQPVQPTTSDRVEAYIKGQMKDPSSFQLIKNQIIDTIMMNKWLIEQYSRDTSMITKTTIENNIDILTKADITDLDNYKKLLEKKTEVYREGAIKDSNEISKHAPDKIFYISYLVDYRAKNSFGALDKGSAVINYYPADSTFKIVNP